MGMILSLKLLRDGALRTLFGIQFACFHLFCREDPGAIVGMFIFALFAISVVAVVACACKRQPGHLGQILARRKSRVEATTPGTVTTLTTTTTIGMS